MCQKEFCTRLENDLDRGCNQTIHRGGTSANLSKKLLKQGPGARPYVCQFLSVCQSVCLFVSLSTVDKLQWENLAQSKGCFEYKWILFILSLVLPLLLCFLCFCFPFSQNCKLFKPKSNRIKHIPII